MTPEKATQVGQEPRIRKVECGICDSTFTDGTVVEIARKVAKHWNHEHGDEFREQPFKTEEYGGRHLHGDEYAVQRQEYYITVYDVLDTSGHSCGPFAYEYVKEPEAEEMCTDCFRSIESVDGYREIDGDGWRKQYLCDKCNREREIERQKENNQKITEFAQ